MSFSILETIVGLLGGLAPVLGLVFTFIRQLRKTSSRKDRLLHLISIRNELTPDSEAWGSLVKEIDKEALKLIEGDEKVRDPFGITLASTFLVGAAAFVVVGILQPAARGGAITVAVLLGFFGIVGLSRSIPKRHRDVNGNIIEDEKSSAQRPEAAG